MHLPLLKSLALSGLLSGALLLTSCDTSIDPLAENDLYFSIFGYLEAGADTQYLRITPVRDALATEPGPIDAEVVLEHLGTGAVTTFQDSLFTFRDPRSGEVAYVHNFWAVLDVEPAASYRLTIRRSDGATTTATATLPDTFPEPRIFPPRGFMQTMYSVNALGIERLADVRLIYHVLDPATQALRRFEFSHIEAASRITSGYSTLLNTTLDAQNMRTILGEPPSIQVQEVQVAAGGLQWPPFDVDLESFARANAANIENGVGLFAGVVSVTVPWPDY